MLRIGDAARLVGVSASTLRHWENEGLIQPERKSGRTRYYGELHIARLREIHRLRTAEGLSPRGVLRALNKGRRSDKEARPDAAAVHPGRGIAAARRELGLSLRQLAERCALSASYLSSLERGASSASLSALHRIGRALERTSVDLFHSKDAGADRKLVRAGAGATVRSADLTLQHLAPGAVSLEPHLVRIPPGGGSGDSYSHAGEEFLHVLSGTVEVTLDEMEIYLLGPGDSLTYSSQVPHRLRNPGSSEAVGIWVNTPPTF